MRGILHSSLADRLMRSAALVVTDRRWAATLSAAALGFGVFVGVAIGPGAAGTLATGAQQIVEIPASGGGNGQSGGGGGGVASTERALPLEGGGGGGFVESLPAPVPLAEPSEAPAPAAPDRAPKPVPAAEEGEAEAEGQVLKGTVVQANRAAGSYALAIEGGELVSVHAPELPVAGTKLSAPLRRLANGTFAEEGDREGGKSTTKVAFRGVVSFVEPDPAAPAYTVSGRGASLLVHVRPDSVGAAPQLPVLGSYVTVMATVEKPEPAAVATEPTLTEPEAVLWQRQVEAEQGPPSTYLDLAGIVNEVQPESAQLLFSADGSRESTQSLILTVPTTIDLAELKVGDSYLATATVEPDGSLTLAGIANDERTKGANDASSAQGDLKR